MPQQFRVGIIGHTGRGNYGHAIDTVWKHIPNAKVVAVADPDEKGRAEAVQRVSAEHGFADYQEMLDKEKLDVVAAAPRWLDQHRDMVVAAAEHGCHVFMEKPFCRSLREADEMVQACEMRHLKLAIAHQTRWTPTIEVAKRLIKDGEIGEILEIRGRGKEDARGGGEDLWVLGSHVLDLMRVFAGDPTDCTASVLENGKPVTAANVKDGNEGIGPLAGDHVQASYTFASGVMGYFASKRGRGGNPARFGIQIFGSKGVLEFLTGHIGICHILRDPGWSPGRSGKTWEPVTSNGIGQAETLENSGLEGGGILAVNDLLSCIGQPDRQPRCSMYDARWTIEMISAVFESHRQGTTVALPLANRQNPLTMLGT
jgi:predicted dehydrogenase